MKRVLCFLALALVFSACQKDAMNPKYLIAKNRIGNLTPTTRVNQLDSVFAGDSVVNKNMSKRFSRGNEITIYQKGGRALLRLQPLKKFDSTSTISNIEVLDTLYKTAKGLGKGSKFKVLKTNYRISRIENILGAVVVFVDDLNAYVIIDKADVLEPKGLDDQIKTSQIKDDAIIDHFWLGWH